MDLLRNLTDAVNYCLEPAMRLLAVRQAGGVHAPIRQLFDPTCHLRRALRRSRPMQPEAANTVNPADGGKASKAAKATKVKQPAVIHGRVQKRARAPSPLSQSVSYASMDDASASTITAPSDDALTFSGEPTPRKLPQPATAKGKPIDELTPVKERKKANDKIEQHVEWLRNEGKRRMESVHGTDTALWTEDERTLYRHICMRGFEPLLPAHWSLDFSTFPLVLFSRDRARTVINSLSGNDFRASKALMSLTRLGARVRALVSAGRNPSVAMHREFLNYVNWAAQDGGFADKRYVPNIAIACMQNHHLALSPKEVGALLDRDIKRQLRALAERWRVAFWSIEGGAGGVGGVGNGVHGDGVGDDDDDDSDDSTYIPDSTVADTTINSTIHTIHTIHTTDTTLDSTYLPDTTVADTTIDSTIDTIDTTADASGVYIDDNTPCPIPGSALSSLLSSPPTSPLSSQRPPPSSARLWPPRSSLPPSPTRSSTSSPNRSSTLSSSLPLSPSPSPSPSLSPAPSTRLRLPTLYGLIIAHGSVIMVTLDAAAPLNPPRCLAVLNNRSYGHDVWNALAIATCICRARDWMVGLARHLGGFEDSMGGGDDE
ncbi:MAG: hypothetical protein M1826_002062 [Phylliscum demangeonii]|nr:MAG: hypothetical protein M1826_002062 [Phylliscum demangeonii]